jgi:hypothetical protein
MQGDLDGACFLYSIANSVVALTGQKPSTKEWSNALKFIPFSHDFIDGEVGTVNYDEQSEIYKFAVKQALSEYSPNKKFNVEIFPELTKTQEVEKLISKNAVVILNISSDHWICVVDTEVAEKTLLAVCSDLGERVNSYQEVKCRFGRTYNEKYVVTGTSRKPCIHKPSVIQITLNH